MNEYWCVYHSDFSGFAVFDDELLALRYAVNNNMQCKAITINEDLRGQLQ